ncbi:MAG: 50S ribosomal protein L10 [Candidatus Zixiibacteriota bacterium]
MPNAQKIEGVAAIKTLFENNKAFFVTDYHGLNVADITTLRRNLRKKNVTFLVAKNTLIKVAANQAGVKGLDDHLIGPTAVAFAKDDAPAAAKILHDTYKEKEKLRMKVFVVDEDVFDGKEIKKLADLPSREALLSMIASAVEAPMVGVVSAINAVFQELLGTIEALAEKKKNEVQTSN